MIEIMALGIVLVTGTFFIALGTASLFTPAYTSRFLLGFASSPAKHYLELAIRFLIGGAFVCSAQQVRWPWLFGLFGWVLLGTTACMLIIPWQWHQRFAHNAVPKALRFLPLVGVASVTFGVLMLVAVIQGNPT